VVVDVAMFDVGVIRCVTLSGGDSGGGGFLCHGDDLTLRDDVTPDGTPPRGRRAADVRPTVWRVGSFRRFVGNRFSASGAAEATSWTTFGHPHEVEHATPALDVNTAAKKSIDDDAKAVDQLHDERPSQVLPIEGVQHRVPRRPGEHDPLGDQAGQCPADPGLQAPPSNAGAPPRESAM